MRILHFIEIENFKRFGDSQRIELDHPAVLIGPNNCGKTTAIQALALWSQAIKTWYDVRKDSTAKDRTATALNRLSIVAVPVQRTRFFWHNTNVRTATKDIAVIISVGVEYKGQVRPLKMRFTSKGDELIYCRPDDIEAIDLEFIKHAANLDVELLYPMSGLETDEPILQPGRINVLLGQGQTAQVLRNLCLIVQKTNPADWERISDLMNRLFNLKLTTPEETSRGTIELQYRQKDVKELLDVSSSGRGFQQMLLIFAYLYSHKGSVLLVDEPDAHLEILRQKQVYVLLRDIATENGSQVVMVTHSEVILDEALENNLTLLLDGKADDLAKKVGIRNSLKHFGADHYVKARERGYVLYVEGGTDVDILRAFAIKLKHSVANIWDERVNSFYVQNNYPNATLDSELERVEGGFGITPREHFKGLRDLLPQLKGLAILDSDARNMQPVTEGNLSITYWKRYEAENYFVNPEVLRNYTLERYLNLDLFGDLIRADIDEVLDSIVLKLIFNGDTTDFNIWKNNPDASRLVWESKTESLKLSQFAEEFFRKISEKAGGPMLLKKGELHQLIPFIDIKSISPEVSEKLDSLNTLFKQIPV
ncbi:MAG: AAA family ATPase [Methylophilaceae bacterium]